MVNLTIMQEEKRVLTNFEALGLLKEAGNDSCSNRFYSQFDRSQYREAGFKGKVEGIIAELNKIGLDGMEILQIVNNLGDVDRNMLYLIVNELDGRFSGEVVERILEISN